MSFPDAEIRREVVATADCPRCGRTVELVAETEGWHEGDGGRFVHASFGPGQGVCCGLLWVDSWDGCQVYELRKPTKQERNRE